MQIEYIVHSANETDIEVVATINGNDVRVKVPGLVVELVTADGRMGHTFPFMPADMDEALALYTVGAAITATFAAKSVAAAPEDSEA